MIRPFSLRDLALVRRLGDHGFCLNTESALTRNHHPLKGALFGLIGSGDSPTFVWRSDDGAANGFIQLQVAFELSARLIYIAIDPPPGADGRHDPYDEDVWLPLLDEVVVAIGQRGLHSLVAEVDELGPELILLRRAGFAIYTRQDIWMLPGPPPVDSTTQLQPHRTVDDWDVEWLYANTVPPLIQLVEPAPPEHGSLWLLHEDGELAAVVHLARGNGAAWLQIYIHPNAYAQADDIVAAAVQICDEKEDFPLYCCVRRYQSWLQGALERARFQRFKSQAVMVKHMSMPIVKKAGALERLLNAQGVRPTTLLQRYEPPVEVHNGWSNGVQYEGNRVRKLIEPDARA